MGKKYAIFNIQTRKWIIHDSIPENFIGKQLMVEGSGEEKHPPIHLNDEGYVLEDGYCPEFNYNPVNVEKDDKNDEEEKMTIIEQLEALTGGEYSKGLKK